MGHCAVPDTRFEKTIMFTGPGSNGKSVMLDILVAMLGPEHVSHVALQDLSENRFQSAELLGKLANIFADLDERAITSSTHFKMLTTGDPITAERKFGQPFKFKNYARMLFSANRMPHSRDRSYAFYRRWIIIPFTRTFSDTSEDKTLKPDKNLREKLYKELPGIFNRALSGLHRLYAHHVFTVPTSVHDALAAYQRDNDTVAAFAKECLEASVTGKIVKQELWRIYRRWCAMQGFKEVNQREFKKSLVQLFPKLDEYREPGGKGPRKWLGIQLTDDAPQEDADAYRADEDDR
jgi:putative DNA primase/helicase